MRAKVLTTTCLQLPIKSTHLQRDNLSSLMAPRKSTQSQSQSAKSKGKKRARRDEDDEEEEEDAAASEDEATQKGKKEKLSQEVCCTLSPIRSS
jgi:hypothetical protein